MSRDNPDGHYADRRDVHDRIKPGPKPKPNVMRVYTIRLTQQQADKYRQIGPAPLRAWLDSLLVPVGYMSVHDYIKGK